MSNPTEELAAIEALLTVKAWDVNPGEPISYVISEVLETLAQREDRIAKLEAALREIASITTTRTRSEEVISSSVERRIVRLSDGLPRAQEIARAALGDG